MKNVLMMTIETNGVDELSGVFQAAGYQLVQLPDLASCCRHLQKQLKHGDGHDPMPAPAFSRTQPGAGAAEAAVPPCKGMAILTAYTELPDKRAQGQMTELPGFILKLARGLVPGWHLSIRRRSLTAPSGASLELTSLEFSFVKIFTMVDMGEAVSRKKIVLEFGEDYLAYDQNRLDIMVGRLRRKVLNATGLQLPLHTVRVRGFSFDDVLIIDV